MKGGSYRRHFLGRFETGRNIVVVDHWDGAQAWILWTLYRTSRVTNKLRSGQLLYRRRD